MDVSHVFFERPPLRRIQPVVRVPDDVGIVGFLNLVEDQADALLVVVDLDTVDALDAAQDTAHGFLEVPDGNANRVRVGIGDLDLGSAFQRRVRDHQLHKAKLFCLVVLQDAQKPPQLPAVRDSALVLVLAGLVEVSGGEAVGDLERNADAHRGDVDAFSTVLKVEDDPLGPMAVNHAARPQNEIGALRTAYENQLGISVGHHLLELAPAPIPRSRVEVGERPLDGVGPKEILEGLWAAPSRLPEFHPGEAGLMNLVQVKHDPQILRTPVIDGKEQRCLVELIVLNTAGLQRVFGQYAFRKIDGGDLGLELGELIDEQIGHKIVVVGCPQDVLFLSDRDGSVRTEVGAQDVDLPACSLADPLVHGAVVAGPREEGFKRRLQIILPELPGSGTCFFERSHGERGHWLSILPVVRGYLWFVATTLPRILSSSSGPTVIGRWLVFSGLNSMVSSRM